VALWQNDSAYLVFYAILLKISSKRSRCNKPPLFYFKTVKLTNTKSKDDIVKPLNLRG
jgi:hypothetical protein